MRIAIIGAGIGGLTLALSLHRVGISCRVFEAAPEIRAVGVGVSLLPHCTKVLDGLGLNDELARVAVTTRETALFNRFGQRIHAEPTGRHAGYAWPQFQVHRGDLQMVLLDAVRQRLGEHAVVTGHRCKGYDQDGEGVTVHFEGPDGEARDSMRGALISRLEMMCTPIAASSSSGLVPGMEDHFR